MQNKILISLGVIVILVFGIGILSLNNTINNLNKALEEKQGAIGNENGYYATTTDSTWDSKDGQKIIKNGYGLYGGFDIPLLTTGTLCFYDGTTTVTHANYATTTIACFGASSVAGSYHPDINFQRGLLAVWSSTVAGAASGTISWK